MQLNLLSHYAEVQIHYRHASRALHSSLSQNEKSIYCTYRDEDESTGKRFARRVRIGGEIIHTALGTYVSFITVVKTEPESKLDDPRCCHPASYICIKIQRAPCACL